VKYRSRADIAAAILYAARKGALKTQVMYRAFVSFPQVEEYLDLLIKQGLIEYGEDSMYYTTDKGMCFLKMYKDIGWMIFPRGALQQINSDRRDRG
jgi:predicted transcriptional regulator